MSKVLGGSVIRRPSTTGDRGTAGCLVRFPDKPREIYMLTAGHCLVGPQTRQFDPVEEVTAMFFTQFLPSSTYPIRSRLRALVAQALVD